MIEVTGTYVWQKKLGTCGLMNRYKLLCLVAFLS